MSESKTFDNKIFRSCRTGRGDGRMKWMFWKKKEKEERLKIVERSNVIQYDVMGYPLRLCIGSDGKQHWRDTNEREGDVVLKWEELEE